MMMYLITLFQAFFSNLRISFVYLLLFFSSVFAIILAYLNLSYTQDPQSALFGFASGAFSEQIADEAGTSVQETLPDSGCKHPPQFRLSPENEDIRVYVDIRQYIINIDCDYIVIQDFGPFNISELKFPSVLNTENNPVVLNEEENPDKIIYLFSLEGIERSLESPTGSLPQFDYDKNNDISFLVPSAFNRLELGSYKIGISIGFSRDTSLLIDDQEVEAVLRLPREYTYVSSTTDTSSYFPVLNENSPYSMLWFKGSKTIQGLDVFVVQNNELRKKRVLEMIAGTIFGFLFGLLVEKFRKKSV